MSKDKLSPCHICDNARINDELTDTDDLSCCSIGSAENNFRIMICSGNNRPLRIEFEKFYEKDSQMHVVGRYYPKYCPECGRKIDEYEKV